MRRTSATSPTHPTIQLMFNHGFVRLRATQVLVQPPSPSIRVQKQRTSSRQLAMDALDRSLDDIIKAKAKKPTGGSARGGKGGRGAGRGGKVTGPTGGRGARGTVLGVRGGGRGGRGGRGGSSRAIAKPVRVIAVPARQQQQVHMRQGQRGRGRTGTTSHAHQSTHPHMHSRNSTGRFSMRSIVIIRPIPKRRVGTRCGLVAVCDGPLDCAVWWGDAHHRAELSFDAPTPHAHVRGDDRGCGDDRGVQ